MSTFDLYRIIEISWEDRTPFEAIKYQFGINEEDAMKIMRRNLKLNHSEFGDKEFQEGILNIWRLRI